MYVVKAQIHAGGRGKAGGVKVVKSLDEVTDVAGEILGRTLVTHQTGPEGREVRRLYVLQHWTDPTVFGGKRMGGIGAFRLVQ